MDWFINHQWECFGALILVEALIALIAFRYANSDEHRRRGERQDQKPELQGTMFGYMDPVTGVVTELPREQIRDL